MIISKSSTQRIPQVSTIPNHIAIIMDGNGRWATSRKLPRTMGHIRGVQAVRRIVEYCAKKNIAYLTLFAFSSENWRRPKEEVNLLMKLFLRSLKKEVEKLKTNNIRLKIVGDMTAFSNELQERIQHSQTITENNTGLTLTICANYGGRWDIMQAMYKMLEQRKNTIPQTIREDELSPFLSMAYAPEPDLFIRTGGEKRVSNFLIWQLAYTELYFSDKYWPDFTAADLDQAIQSYGQRERRFGQTSAQIQS